MASLGGREAPPFMSVQQGWKADDQEAYGLILEDDRHRMLLNKAIYKEFLPG